jgi:hypothetical protein
LITNLHADTEMPEFQPEKFRSPPTGGLLALEAKFGIPEFKFWLSLLFPVTATFF